MRQTLFYIPSWIFDGPLLVTWLIAGGIYFAYLYRQHGSNNETWSFLPVYGIVAAVIHFVVPGLGITGINPQDPFGPQIPMGLAVRGYGLFLMLGILSGVGVTLARCRKIGVSPDQVINLGFWMMLAGIVGARAFYVIQKPEEFFEKGTNGFATLTNIVNMTQGGLVVYGSLIGGSIAAVLFLRSQKLSFLKVADLIAPGMVLGLALGRIGCLMNGCCYGGVCDIELPTLRFPAGSAPYMQQLYRGDLFGIQTELVTEGDESYQKVTAVEPGSLGARSGVVAGDFIAFQFPESEVIRFVKSSDNPTSPELKGKKDGMIVTDRLGSVPVDLPERSRPTHPTQVYSSVNAFLLFLTLWFLWTVRKRDGQVFGLMLILYSISRFLIEIIRKDETGQFGTELTISQWVSIFTILVGFLIFAVGMTRSGKATT
ncbi:MAG: prolipoprotein diacylglyceryl transferase, partial [Planctomycetota bacterium]